MPTVDRSPLFYICMQWCLKHLWIAPKTPVEHAYAKRRWSPQNESEWWLRWQARRQRRAENWCKRRWPCTSPLGRQQAGTSNSPWSSTPQLLSLLPNPGTAHGSFLLSRIMIPLSFQTADLLSSQIVWPELHVANVGPVRSWERQEEYKWCRIQRAFSRRVVQKQVHLQQPITQLQPWYRPSSIHPPTLVRSQSSLSIAGAHYEHWAISLGNFGVTPFFGGTGKSNRKMLAGLIPVQ